MNELKLFDKVSKTDVLSTVFDDGMIVNAGDLDTAMNYPLDMFRTLVRAYFGCGVVCGLKLTKYPAGDADTWCLRVHPGTALDCNANPLKLCDPVTISLKPDPCVCEEWPACVCIAIRRDTLPEGARTDTDDCSGKKKCSYRRLRETVRVKAFKCNDLKNICMRPPLEEHDQTGSANTRRDNDLCACLKECGECECCEDSWVLLGCVNLGECGIEGEVDSSRRKYVKPIECHCPPQREDDPQFLADAAHASTAAASGAAPRGSAAGKKKGGKKNVTKKSTS